MHAPADKTVKHLTTEEWYARYDALDLLPHQRDPSRRSALTQRMPTPADRVATRT